MLSPGRYPTVLAKSPAGNSPSLATIARPSSDVLKAVSRHMLNAAIHSALILTYGFMLFPLPDTVLQYIDYLSSNIRRILSDTALIIL